MARNTCLFIANCIFLWLQVAPTNAWLSQRHLVQATPLKSTNDNDDCFSLEVTSDGRTCTIEIEPEESILSAMERSGVIEDVPSDCRRGNCLTCVGRHAPGSKESSLERGLDGLAPHLSEELEERGHLLLCSSFVTGDGLKLELGQNHRAWDDMYRERLESESTRKIGLEAVAKTMRLRSEANVEEWTEETEVMLEKSGDQSSS